MHPLDILFSPRSVALVGASPDEMKLGGVAFRNLRAFRGKFYPVAPTIREIDGVPVFPSIADIPEMVDLSVILRPAPEIPAILAAHAGKAHCAVIVSAGFAETGQTALQEEVARIGRDLGIRILGPNCLGVFSPARRLDTFFLPTDRLKRPKKGNVAVVSQSGALLMCLLEALAQAGQGVSRGVNYGNAVDLDAPDIYDYLAGDTQTRVAVSYLESVGDGRLYVEAARALSRKKPLLVLKAGKGEGGQTAAYSHTGRLAGRYEVFSSIMRQFGIREVGDFDELLDATHALAMQGGGGGERVCIITDAGGLGVLAADECSRVGLELPTVPAEAQERLRALFPPFYALGNPVDLTGQVRDDQYLETLCEVRDSYDGFLIIAHTGVAGVTPRIAQLLCGFRRECDKPLVVCMPKGGIGAKVGRLLEKGGIPVYFTPEHAARGLRALLRRD